MSKSMKDTFLFLLQFEKERFEEAFMMKSRETFSAVGVDFKELTPNALPTIEQTDSRYEKAFLSREEKGTTEFARNTTTWD